MRYRPFGRTGFEVSEISLGTVEIGMPYGIAENGNAPMPEEAASARLLNYALDQGINYIDPLAPTARARQLSAAPCGIAAMSSYWLRRFSPIMVRTCRRISYATSSPAR